MPWDRDFSQHKPLLEMTTYQITMKRSIAYFISPHGFGHAARAAATMNALHAQDPALHFEIFTRVPRWLFQDSVREQFTYHPLLTDVGLAQESALNEDLPQTLRRLQEFFPFDAAHVAQLAQRVARLKCKLVMCDIAPLGIAVARAAGVPSVLVENFTWDWIYAGYARYEARFQKHIAYLRGMFKSADYHIQTEPVCQPRDCDLVTRPVSREPRTPARQIRAQLGIPPRARVVLITMGGTQSAQQHAFLDRLTQIRHVRFIVSGNSRRAKSRDNLILLPPRSAFYHPDLVNASDAVIGKAGYSTVAEAYRAGIPFGYISREKFREAKTMARFIETEMRGYEISAADFENGRWIARLDDLLTMPRLERRDPNGAEQIAQFIFAA
jgi:UDP:flavonoid glycosyltransferase YjiC (YdhE family)